MITLSQLGEGCRRRWWLWTATALLGLIIGASFHLLLPANYVAVTELYLVEPTTVDPTTGMADDASLLETSAVAAQAVKALHLDVNANTFLSSYTGKPLSDAILQIKLNAASPANAISYANAVASAFLTVRGAELAVQTNLAVTATDTQISNIDSRINHLTQQIDALSSSPGSQAATQVAELVDSRTSDATQASQLQAQVRQDLLDQSSVVKGSYAIDPAASAQVSAKKVAATDGLSGLIAGLFLGLGVVSLEAIVSDRPRRRAEVAAALGAPVELSLRPYRPSRLTMRGLLKRPTPPLRMIERRLVAHLESSPRRGLAVVELQSVDTASLGVGLAVITLASEGKNVLVIDMAAGRPLATLLPGPRKRGVDRCVSVGDGGFTLVIGPDDPSQLERLKMPDDTDAVLLFTSADPAFGADHIVPWADEAVVFLTAGKASATRIASTGQMLQQSGIEAISAILLGASSTDETFGSQTTTPIDNAAERRPTQWETSAEFDGVHLHNSGDPSPGAVPESVDRLAGGDQSGA